jgi:recombinational DNA repair protein RecR
MNSEMPFTAVAPPVFDGINYQVWAVRMEAYLDANDLWEAVEQVYECQLCQTIQQLHKSKITERRSREHRKQKQLCLQQSHPPFFTE